LLTQLEEKNLMKLEITPQARKFIQAKGGSVTARVYYCLTGG